MTSVFEEDSDATPLSPAERQELIPTHITLRAELNELEQNNIVAADLWAFSRKRDVMNIDFLFTLHKRMFGDVWRWAGTRRATERNLGSLPHLIEPELHTLVGDVRVQVENMSYPADEIAVRFHHRLVLIHPFPNGNGRWSRMAADLLSVRLERPRFTWGSNALQPANSTRAAYIASLKAADNHDITPLLQFARS